MEVNKEEALRCLSIAQKHRNGSNLPSALKFAKKSVALYETPEGKAMVMIVEREIESGGSSSSSASTSDSRARATGAEPNMTSARARAAGGGGTGTSEKGGTGEAAEKGKKREYTVKQMEVVKRVKGCQGHEYYQILAVEKSCTENDVKKAYKKLALALHPDKNGAPGADEAFKMVSKAFQVLSDANLRAAFDQNPHSDPTSRGGGGGGGGFPSRGSGFGHPGFSSAGGFQGDIDPADLFNMFFGGGGGGMGMGNGFGGGFGGGNVFTFGGTPAFQTRRRRPGPPGAAQAETGSPLLALLPLLLLFAFALLSLIPSIFTSPPDPEPKYAFERTSELSLGRETFSRGVGYWVEPREWEASAIWQSVPDARKGETRPAMWGGKLRGFERGVEQHYIRKLQNECEYYNARKQQKISELAGFFGIGADYDAIRELRAEKSESCEQLRKWGLATGTGGGYY